MEALYEKDDDGINTKKTMTSGAPARPPGARWWAHKYEADDAHKYEAAYKHERDDGGGAHWGPHQVHAHKQLRPHVDAHPQPLPHRPAAAAAAAGPRAPRVGAGAGVEVAEERLLA